MLQKMQSRKLLAVDKMVDPPTQGPTKLKKAVSSTMPGRKNWVDVHVGQKGMEAIYMVEPGVLAIREDIQEARKAISDYYYEPVFLAMIQDLRKERATATEVLEIREEKAVLIGPVLERLNVDFLSPLIDITFYEMNEFGMIPPAPNELQGMPLKVRYVSSLAQQQKLIAVGKLDRFLGFLTGYAAIDANVIHKVKSDKMVDEYADILGISPGSLRTEEEFNALLQQIQQAQQAQAMSEQAEQMSGSAKNLSQAETSDGGNVLDKLMEGGEGGARALQ